LRRKQQPPFVQDGGRTGIRRAAKAGWRCRSRKRQLKAGLHKTKNFGCPLQFEMCRKIKNFKGLSAGQWQMFARTRASAPFLLFCVQSIFKMAFCFLLLFDVVKKNRSGLWCRQMVVVSKVSPPDPHCRVSFFLVQERQMLRLNMDPPSVFYHI